MIVVEKKLNEDKQLIDNKKVLYSKTTNPMNNNDGIIARINSLTPFDVMSDINSIPGLTPQAKK